VSYLTHRAERAVLGALLADPTPPDHLYGLTSNDFASRLHRDLFTALSDLALARPELDLPERDAVLAAMVTRPGATLADLDQLRQAAPDPAAAASYAELVRTASIHRDVADYADHLTRTVNHPAPASKDATAADLELSLHHRRLAIALTRHADAFRPVTAPTIDTPDADQPLDVVAAIETGRSARAVLEDQVLADLLRDPEQILTVSAFLTDNAFSSPLRRHAYRTLVALAYDGDPIDEVTVAWTVEVQAAQARLHGVDVNAPGSTPDERPYPTTETDTEPAAVYLARLTTTTLTVTSAVHAGRDLLAIHLRDTVPAAVTTSAATAARQRVARLATRPAVTQPVTRIEGVREQQVAPVNGTGRAAGAPLRSTEPSPGVEAAPAPATPSARPGVRP